MIKVDRLKEFVRDVWKSCTGADDDDDAESIAESLTEANLYGIDTHGVRLLELYTRRIEDGSVKKRPRVTITTPYPCLHIVDADGGLGAPAGFRAIDECIRAAEMYGMSMANVRNVGHAGCMGVYTRRAARRGYIAYAFSACPSSMATPNGKEPYFGTNPISFAAPRGRDDSPFCIDTAMTETTVNWIWKARNEGRPVPEGWALDASGAPTTDARDVLSLMPIGGHKGFALAAMVEVMTSILAGFVEMNKKRNPLCPSQASLPSSWFQTYIVCRADGFVSQEEFETTLKKMDEKVRQIESRDGENVLMPGDRSSQLRQKRLREGIPLDEKTEKILRLLSDKYKVPLPAI